MYDGSLQGGMPQPRADARMRPDDGQRSPGRKHAAIGMNDLDRVRGKAASRRLVAPELNVAMRLQKGKQLKRAVFRTPVGVGKGS